MHIAYTAIAEVCLYASAEQNAAQNEYLSHYNHAHAQTYAQPATAAVVAATETTAAVENIILDIEQCNAM